MLNKFSFKKLFSKNYNYNPISDTELAHNIYIHYFKEYPNCFKFDLRKSGKNLSLKRFSDELTNLKPITNYEVMHEKTYDIDNFNYETHQVNKGNYSYEYVKKKDVIDQDQYSMIVFILNKLVIKIMSNSIILVYYNSKWDISFFENLCKQVHNDDYFYDKDEKGLNNEISFITESQNGLKLTNFIPNRKDVVDINKNYNDDFKEIDGRIKKYISENKNGLILLHSEPGTGKTFYIRHLINNVDKKKFVYIPPNMTNILSNPSFINFAIENLNNSTLIIEDAENVIEQRNSNVSNQSVANLLNLSDGLMSDVLNLQIICTFNCHVDKIDQALLRKGRLLLKYKFEKLEAKKANDLLEHLGKERSANEPMPLSDIYNSEDNNSENVNNKESNTIGFQFNN